MAQTTSHGEEHLEEPLNYTREAPSLLSETSHSELYYKIYRRRWSVLFMYVCFAFVNNMQWIQYVIINNLVMRYYNVGGVSVDWTSIIFMATFVPLIFPALYFLEKKVGIILIAGMNCQSFCINDTNLICRI
jgi:FLVCR family feline leukemia virus subgroup C receptor-related protein